MTHHHITAALVWRGVCAALGGGSVVAVLYKLIGMTGKWGLTFDAWRKRVAKARDEEEIARVQQEREDDRARDALLEQKNARLDAKADNFMSQVLEDVQHLRAEIKNLTARITDVEEKSRLSDLTAQAAHIRADESDKRADKSDKRADESDRKYAAAQVEVMGLRAENGRLLEEVERLAATGNAAQDTIRELTARIAENHAMIEEMQAEINRHRLPQTFDAHVTLTEQDDSALPD